MQFIPSLLPFYRIFSSLHFYFAFFTLILSSSSPFLAVLPVSTTMLLFSIKVSTCLVFPIFTVFQKPTVLKKFMAVTFCVGICSVSLICEDA